MMLEHLKSRRLDVTRYSAVWVDEESKAVTFGLWNLSGKLVGIQQYRPDGSKAIRQNPKECKYFTRAGSVDCHKHIMAFGVELLDPLQAILFVAEGIFDIAPLHNRGINALALLKSSCDESTVEWLHSLGYFVVALCDGDKGGERLAPAAHMAITLPEGKDPADMPEEWFDDLVKTVRGSIEEHLKK